MLPNTNPVQEALGSAMLDARAADKVLALDANDFATAQDKAIFGAMKALQARGEPITLVTLDSETKGEYTTYLINISTAVVTTALIDHHINAIKETSKRRKIRAAATALYNAAAEGTKIGRASCRERV
jgi:replicative DNA helicase